jgi:general stress protein 26
MDGEQLIFTTWHDSLKGKALRTNPRVSLLIQDEDPPFSFVVIEGTVTVSEEPTELRYWAGRLGGRYQRPSPGLIAKPMTAACSSC